MGIYLGGNPGRDQLPKIISKKKPGVRAKRERGVGGKKITEKQYIGGSCAKPKNLICPSKMRGFGKSKYL